MTAATSAKRLLARYRGPLAAVSAIAGVAVGVLGNLVTNHWLWGTFCGLLVLTAFVAATEALKAWREDDRERSLAVNSPASSLPYTAFSYTGASHSFGHNTSVGTVQVAGGNIDDHRKTVFRNNTTTIKVGGFWLVALVALIVAISGTLHMRANPGGSAPQNAAALAAEGGHSSPAAAVKGFFGNAFQNNWTDACGYEPPSEQASCDYGASAGNPPEFGTLAVGSALIEGTRALVPVSGRVCRSGECADFHGSGLPQGSTFDIAFADALDPPDSSANLVPCQEVGNKWYVDGVNP